MSEVIVCFVVLDTTISGKNLFRMGTANYILTETDTVEQSFQGNGGAGHG